MSTETNKIVSMMAKRRENFISKRSIFEKEIETYRESLKQTTQETQEKMGIDLDKLDARVLFPSLYKETLDLAEYEKERKAYGELLSPLIAIRKQMLIQAEGLANES